MRNLTVVRPGYFYAGIVVLILAAFAAWGNRELDQRLDAALSSVAPEKPATYVGPLPKGLERAVDERLLIGRTDGENAYWALPLAPTRSEMGILGERVDVRAQKRTEEAVATAAASARWQAIAILLALIGGALAVAGLGVDVSALETAAADTAQQIAELQAAVAALQAGPAAAPAGDPATEILIEHNQTTGAKSFRVVAGPNANVIVSGLDLGLDPQAEVVEIYNHHNDD